jgi:flavin reductase (DIM6/NTAB) family NADH-FMN oxidoreductase RutF
MATLTSFDPELLDTRTVHKLLSASIAPRPIAFASTVDAKGNVNLSPFSFFNVFSSNPPILIFSPARRVRDNTTKHTLQNAAETKEVVINSVDFSIVEQMSASSKDYAKGVNEFIESGLTEVPSLKVKPPRVLESPVSFECVVDNIISLGEHGGAGQLVIAKVVHIHVKSEILDANNEIDSEQLDLVARLGGDWYTRVTKESMFKLEKPRG